MGKVSTIADYFVIATADSERQAKAMVDDINKAMKQEKKKSFGKDAETTSGWVLLDYGDVIVHLFDPGTRDFYNLEELWSNAPVVLRIQ